jgi:hypothetical protein
VRNDHRAGRDHTQQIEVIAIFAGQALEGHGMASSSHDPCRTTQFS